MAGGLDCRPGIERVVRFDQVQTRKSRAGRDYVVVRGRCRRYGRLRGETGEMSKDGEREGEFAAKKSVAGCVEQACSKSRPSGRNALRSGFEQTRSASSTLGFLRATSFCR